MMLKKIFKYVVVVPVYLFLLIEGFIGGGTGSKDIWDDLMKWVNK